MGIIMGAIGGLGQGLANVGQQYVKAGFDEENDARTLERQRILQREQADLMTQREKTMEQFKAELGDTMLKRRADTVRGGVEGIVGSQFDAARSAYANAPDITDEQRQLANEEIAKNQKRTIGDAMTDPAMLKKGALATGQLDTAMAMDKMIDKPHNVPFGTVAIDNEGNVKFDNAAEYNKAIQQQKADASTGRAGAALYRAQNGAGGKPMTDAQKLALEQKLNTTIDKQYNERNKAHPLNVSDDPNKPDVDAVRRDVVKDLVERGTIIKGYDQFNEVHRDVEKLATAYDKDLTAAARAEAKKTFTNIKPQDKEKLVAAGVPEDALQSEKHYAHFLRDQNFNADNMQAYYQANKGKFGGNEQPAKTPTATQPQVANPFSPAPIIKPNMPDQAAAPTAAADPLASEKNWIKEKLMGAFSGPSKYQEIAQSHPNERVRRAAQELWDQYQSRVGQE